MREIYGPLPPKKQTPKWSKIDDMINRIDSVLDPSSPIEPKDITPTFTEPAEVFPGKKRQRRRNKRRTPSEK